MLKIYNATAFKRKPVCQIIAYTLHIQYILNY